MDDEKKNDCNLRAFYYLTNMERVCLSINNGGRKTLEKIFRSEKKKLKTRGTEQQENKKNRGGAGEDKGHSQKQENKKKFKKKK